MNYEIHQPVTIERNEKVTKSNGRKLMTTLGVVALGVGVAYGAAEINSHLESEKERINNPTGTKLQLSADECVEILPNSKLRENPDGRDLKFEEVERVFVVEEAPIALCGLDSVRLKSNTDAVSNMIGLSGESLIAAGLPSEDIEALVENGETDFVWVLDSDETASIVKEKDLQ